MKLQPSPLRKACVEGGDVSEQSADVALMPFPGSSSVSGSGQNIVPDHVEARFLNFDDLTERDRLKWALLSELGREGSVFAASWFMEPALKSHPERKSIRLLVVMGKEGNWIGVMPIRIADSFGRWPFKIWSICRATNQFVGTPLIARGEERTFWLAALDFLDNAQPRPVCLCAEELPADDLATQALIELCDEQRRDYHAVRHEYRAAWFAKKSDYYQSIPLSKRAKKDASRLRSLARRLEKDHGPVTLVHYSQEDSCCDWIDEFLRLEQSGWKGRAKSAIASDAATEKLLRDVICNGADRRQVRLASLEVGGRKLAMVSWLVQGGRTYGFKTAFDEDYAHYAPGLILMRDIVPLIQEDTTVFFDSCASANMRAYDRFWPDRRCISHYAVSLKGRKGRFRMVMAMRDLLQRMRKTSD